jgi:ectoine hydroxylase-related dioxygenase (phytanoyl-CoA dioxygenase family)
MEVSGVNSAEIAARAEELRVRGYTLFAGLLPAALVTEMREAFDALLENYRATHPTNRGANRFQMYLPFEPPLAHPLLYENDDVLAVAQEVLGEQMCCEYFASDTPLPGSDYQRTHSDTRLLFPEYRISLPAYGLVLNVPLVDVTLENGPLEIWPGGTHLWPGGGDVDALAKGMPSERLTMPAGTGILRDLRMWHRGTPNRGERSRPHLALVYTRAWYRFEQEPPTIRRSVYEGLSPRAKALFRFANRVDG